MRPIHLFAASLAALLVGSLTVAAPRVNVPGLRTVQDEGTPVTFRNTLNFAGSGVSCVDDTTRTTCTIAGSSGYATVQDEGTPLTARTTINFTGAGVTCTDNGGSSRTDCTIPGGGGASPLTTKGDLYTFTTTDARLPVGGDGLCLTANSAQATGLEWASCSGSGGGLTHAQVQRLVFLGQ